MDKITEHHYRNIAEGKAVDNSDGSLSTVRTVTVEYNGVTYLIPTVWDGEILELEDAEKRAFSEGVYETFENETEARRFDALIHEDFFDTTTPEEAEMALSKSESRKGIKTREGEIMAEKKFQLDENDADTDGDGELSAYEKEKAEAVQKAKADKDLEELEMSGGGLLLNENERQRYYDSHNITGSTTIRDGTGHKRYVPIEGGGFEEDPNGSVVMITDRDGDVLYKFIDKIVPAYDILEKSGKPIPRPDNLVPPLGDPYDEFDRPSGVSGDDPYDPDVPPLGDPYDEINDLNIIKENNEAPDEDPEDPEKQSILDKLKDWLGLAHGGLMSDNSVGYDKSTGNKIPPGSSAENVQDDIPAALSTGEYVLPADVVRWHGLKHIQDMMTEAKTGLMCMQMDGQIKDISDEEEMMDASEKDKSRKTPEGNEVEVAQVEVEIEEMELDDEMKEDEDYSKKKKKKSPSITSTPNVVYMTG